MKSADLLSLSRLASSLGLTAQDWQYLRKPIITAFIIFHLVCNFSYLFNNHPFFSSIVTTVWPYYAYLGLDQNWGVFAPKPREDNPHMVAMVSYRDGSTRMWLYPRVERYNLFERMFKERYRKFGDDNTVWPKFRLLWADLAIYIARRNYFDRDNPPETVTLIRMSRHIDPPEIGLHKVLNGPHNEVDPFLTYNVRAGDLSNLTDADLNDNARGGR